MQQWLTEHAPVNNEDLERHDKWLCMMWPRLHLLKELLADDGIIFISIDDNEVHHLRMLMDEILGRANFLADIIWQHRYGRSNNAKLFSNQREHIIAYRKSDAVSHIRVKQDAKLDETYSNPDNDPRGSWVSSSYVNPATKEQRPNLVYAVINPHTEEAVNHPTHAWKYSQSTHEKHVRENRLWWGLDRNLRYPRLKNFLSESEEKGIVPIDLMLADTAGTTDEGTKQLQTVFQSTVIMRQPHAQRTGNGVLDQCYVYCNNAEVRTVVTQVKNGLEMVDSYEIQVRSDDRPLLRRDYQPLQLTLFEPIFEQQFDSELEKRFAYYLDEELALQWWHQVAARQRGEYYLQRWKRGRIYPDFVAMANEIGGVTHVIIFDTKGEHLAGNLDTEYKRKVLETLEGALNSAGRMVVRDGPTRQGIFQLVFNEQEFLEISARLDIEAYATHL